MLIKLPVSDFSEFPLSLLLLPSASYKLRDVTIEENNIILTSKYGDKIYNYSMSLRTMLDIIAYFQFPDGCYTYDCVNYFGLDFRCFKYGDFTICLHTEGSCDVIGFNDLSAKTLDFFLFANSQLLYLQKVLRKPMEAL